MSVLSKLHKTVSAEASKLEASYETMQSQLKVSEGQHQALVWIMRQIKELEQEDGQGSESNTAPKKAAASAEVTPINSK